MATLPGYVPFSCLRNESFARRKADQQGPDAQLTPKGIADTQGVNAAWKEQIKAGIPLPQTLYTSPMRRAASTAELTWSDILFTKGNVPYVCRLLLFSRFR